jgi:hypothetical protein
MFEGGKEKYGRVLPAIESDERLRQVALCLCL